MTRRNTHSQAQYLCLEPSEVAAAGRRSMALRATCRGFAFVSLFVLAACGDGTGLESESQSTGAITTATNAGSSETLTESETSPTTGQPTGPTSGSDSDSDSSDASTASDTDVETETETETDATSVDSDSDPTTETTDSTDSDSSDSDSSDTEPWEPVPCQVETTKSPATPSNLVFVLDKSGSMTNEVWDHDADVNTPVVSRWQSLFAVVEAIVLEFDDRLRFGAKLFPKKTAGAFLATGACEVDPGIDVPVAPNNGEALLLGIPEGDAMVQGGTPMQSGVSEAFDYLLGLPDDLDKAIVLVADGEISCEESFFTVISEASYLWDDHGVGTYVVGIDVNEQTQYDLNALANVGGKPNDGEFQFYQTHNQVELEAAFQTIIDDTISCNIQLDPVPDQPELFEVWIGEQKIEQVDSCQDAGWMWVGNEYDEIVMCADACQALKSAGEIEGRYYCVPE